jgi:hypothetical protein
VAAAVDNLLGGAARRRPRLNTDGCRPAELGTETPEAGLRHDHAALVQPFILTIVAGFGIDAVIRDPGSIDPERGSGTPGDRLNSFLGRDSVPILSLPILGPWNMVGPLK